MFNFIGSYIEKLNINEINTFLKKNNIFLNEEELIFTYEYIIKNWKRIISNPKSFDFNNYKNKYSENNFNKLNKLIDEYRQKYNI